MKGRDPTTFTDSTQTSTATIADSTITTTPTTDNPTRHQSLTTSPDTRLQRLTNWHPAMRRRPCPGGEDTVPTGPGAIPC